MAEAGKAHGLLNTFLGLRKSHKEASMSIHSDSDGHLKVTITVTVAVSRRFAATGKYLVPDLST